MVSMEEIQKKFKLINSEVSKVVIGQDKVVEQLLVALLCNGHVYLEGYPGLAKTLLVKTISNIMDLKFSRIQGTPDLLPSDVTGTYIIDESKGKKEFKFQPGPIFANIILLDEVNRATPKTHSSILEAMQERQVTVGNATYKLEEPFFVLATGNPIEQEGSLTLDQSVFINGELKTGHELLEQVKNNNTQILKNGDFDLYKLEDSYTYSLNSNGKLKKSECYLYTLPYDDEIIKVKTRIGREIKVSKNHPFLINEKGEIKWKKAEELIEGDYLVTPAALNDEYHTEEVVSHLGILNELNKKYKIIKYEEYLKLKEHKEISLPSWILNLNSELRKEFLKTFISLEGCIRDNMIKVSQANKNNINILSYLLLKEGIISLFFEKKKKNHSDYVIKIQGEDFLKYLLNIGWLNEETRIEWLNRAKNGKFSSFRVIPTPRNLVLRLVNLLGINLVHTYKNRKNFVNREWYCGYKSIKEGRENISLDMFKLMLNGMEKEINLRNNVDLNNISKSKDIKNTAILCGLSIKDIETNINIPFNKISNYYENNNSKHSQQIITCVKNEFLNRLEEAKSILNYLKKLATEEVLYDKIEKLSYEPYNGLIFGLTVPGLQNYIGGYGACGINHNTFKLSEAQVDRFLFKINVEYPKIEEELEIVSKYSEITPAEIKIKTVFTSEELIKLQSYAKQIPIAKDILKYAVDLVVSTRNNKQLIEYGASPRASISLIMAGKARALINGRKYVSKDDINVMALPVLRHRIIISFEAERQNMTEDDVITKLIKK